MKVKVREFRKGKGPAVKPPGQAEDSAGEQNLQARKTAPDFRFYTGALQIFEKKDADGNPVKFIRGVASDDKPDRHGERFSRKALARMVETAKEHLTLFSDHNRSWEDTLGHVVEAALNGSNEFTVLCQLESEEAEPKVRKLWAKLKSKTKLAFSISGRVLSSYVEEIGDRAVRVLDDIELFELSIVGLPANPRTWVEAIMKSFDAQAQDDSKEDDMKDEERKKLEADHAESLAKLKAESDSATAALKSEFGNRIAVLTTEMDQAVTAASKSAAELAAKIEEIQSLKDEVEQVTKERDALIDQVTALENQIKAKDGEFAQAAQKAQHLQAELERLSAAINETTAAYDDLKAKYDQMVSAQPEMQAQAAIGKQYQTDLIEEAHRLAGLIEGDSFDSDTTKKKLSALALPDLKKEIEGLKKRFDEKFPPTATAVRVMNESPKAAEERQAQARQIVLQGATLFEDRRVRTDG